MVQTYDALAYMGGKHLTVSNIIQHEKWQPSVLQQTRGISHDINQIRKYNDFHEDCWHCHINSHGKFVFNEMWEAIIAHPNKVEWHSFIRNSKANPKMKLYTYEAITNQLPFKNILPSQGICKFQLNVFHVTIMRNIEDIYFLNAVLVNIFGTRLQLD